MQAHELSNTALANKLEVWAEPHLHTWSPAAKALTKEAISRLRKYETFANVGKDLHITHSTLIHDYLCTDEGEAVVLAVMGNGKPTPDNSETPNADLSDMLERWAIEHSDSEGYQDSIISEAINRLRRQESVINTIFECISPTVMSNADYLTLAAVTAKPTPDGIRIPANLANKIEALLMDFRDTAMQLEGLKKAVFYGDEPAASVMCKHLTNEQAQTLHAVLGMIGETSEMVDCFSTNMDGANRESLVKELGDHRWYEAILLRLVGITQEEIHEKNIAKLKARYGGKFSAAALACVDTFEKENYTHEEVFGHPFGERPANPHIGSDFDDMLVEEGILEEVTEGAMAKIAGRCTHEGCFVHEGETCPVGEMNPKDCEHVTNEHPLGR